MDEVMKVKKTRKEHICEGCFETIPKGGSCFSYSGVGKNGFYRYYLCDRCNRFADEFPDYVLDNDNYFIPGSFKEALRQYFLDTGEQFI
ncbi:MAG: hypothetical protein K6U04_01615 [Armatimonadetes bacterium]|nr:hypothetical protein [Armatimonadota bacterium]